MTMDNKPFSSDITWNFGGFIVFLGFAIVSYFRINLLAATSFIIFGSLIFFAGFYRWYYATPRAVDIGENGITMHMANGKSKTVNYEDIISFLYEPGDPSRKGDMHRGMGAMSLKGKNVPRLFQSDISIEIREAYKRKYGKYPPRRG